MKKFILSVGTLLLLSVGGYAQSCFTPNWSGTSLDSMLIYVSLASVDTSDLQAGDEIGVFDGNECVGVGVLSSELTGGPPYLIIEVSRDNPLTLPVDGFTEGSTISYRFCYGGEVLNQTVSANYLTNGPGFVSNDSAIVELLGINNSPLITSSPDAAVLQGATYNYTVNATDLDGDALVYSAPTLPAWLIFNAGTRQLSGIPGNNQVGDHDVIIRVSDGFVNVDQPFTITVTNDPPIFSSSPALSVLQGDLYSYTAVAVDVDPLAVLTYSATSIPDWLIFDPVTQILTGTPGNDDVGDHGVTIRVNDGHEDVDQSFTITVNNDPPTFTSTPDLSVLEGDTYIYTAVAVDVDPLAVLTYSEVLIPAWLDFDPDTQILTGTPGNDDVGDHEVTIRVNDGHEDVDQSFTIQVVNDNDAPTFTIVPDTVATEDVLYSSSIAATDIDEDDELTYIGTSVPAWLVFDEDSQVLSGTPGNEQVGYHAVTLSVSDGTTTVDTTFTIHVYNVNDAPTFTTVPDTVAMEDVLYSSSIAATDIDVGDVLSYTGTSVPAWLLFDPGTRVLSGTPGNDQVGYHSVTLSVFDGTVTVDTTFSIHVYNANDAPVFTSIPDTVATEDVLYSSTVTAEDIDGDGIIYSAPLLPDWLLFDANTQVLSGTPGNDEVGRHNVTLRIFDGTATVDSTFSIRVDNVNDAPTFTSLPDTMALEDVLYSSAVTAQDIDGDSIRFRAPVRPAWLSFNDTTHILSGTPANVNVGDHTVTLRIFDGTVFEDSTFVIHVENTNDAPTFVSMPDTIALEDVLYSSAVTAQDIDGDSIIYRAPLLPAWLSFNDTTHVLSGTPVQDDVGEFNVTLRISDGTLTVDSTFVLTVLNTNDAPTFTSTPVITGLQGALYTYTVTAEDIDGDTLIFSAPVRPLWLSFDPVTRTLSGTPGNDQVGTHSVSLAINDGTVFVVQSFSILVANVNDPPHFTSTPIEEARPGSAYTYTVRAEDIDGDALTYTARVLPGWLTFNASTQVLSATPGDEDVGDQHVTIRVSDGSLHADQTFVISVSYGNHAPIFTSDPATSIVVGESYVYTIRAQDIDGDVLSYSAPVLPGWLTFYPSTNVVSGIPRVADLGRHNVTVRVSDGTVTADQTFSITVENVNTAPFFTSTPSTSVVKDHLYVYYVAAEDADGDALSFSAPVLPDWLNFDAGSLILHGTPGNGDVGDHPVSLLVSDGEDSENQEFTVTVELESGVGIDDLYSPGFLKIFPNPSDGRFIVELAAELEKELNLQILDPLGKVLMQQEFPPYYQIREEYNLSNRPAGLYFIRIYHDSGQILGKLILR